MTQAMHRRPRFREWPATRITEAIAEVDLPEPAPRCPSGAELAFMWILVGAVATLLFTRHA